MKRIKITNDKEKRRFYRKLPLYRSVFCIFTKFEIETTDKDIKIIEKALNLKSNKKRITYIFDETIKQIDDFYKDIKNPCGFDKCHKCHVQKTKDIGINGCCRMCKYQSTKGCTTENIACKFFNCTEVTSRHKTLEFDDVKILQALSYRQRTILKSDYFSKKEDVIKDLQTGSILIGTIRMTTRLLIDLFRILFS